MADRAEVDQLAFHAVDAGRWADLERLFESRGGPKHCWCMAWRATPEERKRTGGASRKAALAGRVAAGVPIGLLGYLDGGPVAWCSVAPRSTYRRLVEDDSSDEGIWSIVCFFVVRRLRGQGFMRRMIEAAVEFARRTAPPSSKPTRSMPIRPATGSWGSCRPLRRPAFLRSGERARVAMSCG